MREELTKKDSIELEDELRPEYDLKSLQVRKFGPGRKSFGPVVRLDPDVAEMFPTADAVNEALRFLMRVTRSQTLSTSAQEIAEKTSTT